MDKRFLNLDDLTHMPPPSWMIEGIFEAKSLVMLAGPSYSFKSFLLLDWMLCMASGRKWLNRSTVPCKVAYALGEGKSSLLKRITAWITFNDLSREEVERINENFRVTFEVPQLATKSSVDNMLSDIETEGFKPELIAIDTFARSMVGMDENNQKDTGLWIEQADRLRQLGYGVIFLHHTKKNTEFGVTYRGSTTIIGAMDTAMTLVREGNYCTLTITKQKDHDEGKPIRFRRALVGAGAEDSCVLVPAPLMDERFIDEPKVPSEFSIDDHIDLLLKSPNFSNDAERAKELVKLTGITEGAAKTRISRKRG